ncbi:MAG TPA: hypothetical protein VNF75_05985 [Candidatus Dormibacteraeota bacterium]|nr:hypothetical protein [Candidatus Dormibacteraeota bacterium]
MAASPVGRRLPSRGQLLTLPRFVALVALLTGMLAARPQVMDPDFWWHLRNGDTMLATGHLIHINPYAFMAAGHHWVLQEWLSEVWMAAAVGVGGRPGVVVVYWLVTLAVFCVIWARSSQIGPIHGITVGCGLFLAAITAYPILGPRSQMESYLLIGVVLLLVERQLRRGGWAAWLLPPLFLIWSNLHAGFIMGLILLLAVLGAEWVQAALGQRSSLQRSRLAQLSWAALCSVAASLVNPNGSMIVVYPFQTQFSNAQQSLIQEWHSPDFHSVVLLPLLVLILTLAWLVVRYRGLPLRELVVLGLSLLVTLQSVRNLVILVVAGIPVWITLAERLRLELAGRWTLRLRPRQPRALVLLELLLLGGLAAILAVQVGTLATPALDSATYVNAFPYCASRWLDTAPAGLRIFNQYGDGGFLAYTVPKDKVFVFGDAALMGPQVLRDYAAIIDLSPTWLARLDTSPAQLVLFERGTAFPDALQREPSWALVYRDRRVEIFARTALISSLHLPANPTTAYWRERGVPACSAEVAALPA